MSLTLDDLQDDLKFPDPASKRRRGYDFETYLYEQFEKDALDVKRPFKSTGEQVDGGVFLDGRWYLIEAKWHAKELPASEVYAFKGKVDGKLAGTCGFFISWSGFSEECADALAFGKSLNVLLCDADDVRRAEKAGWSQVLREKLRQAALFGDLYWSAPTTTGACTGATYAEFFVEGAFDEAIIRELLQLKYPSLTSKIYRGNGKIHASRLANSLPKAKNTRRMLIIDGDGNPDAEYEFSSPLLDGVIAIEPTIEALFYPGVEDPKARLVADAQDMHRRPIHLAISRLPEVIKDNPQKFFSRVDKHLL